MSECEEKIYSNDASNRSEFYETGSTFSDESEPMIYTPLQKKQENMFMKKYKYIFLGFVSFVMFGGFYNNSFQAFIKEQFLHSMSLSNSQYSQFLSIPPLPNIVFPIIAGPLIDIIGVRTGLIFFSVIMLLGMTLMYTSAYSDSFTLILIGKIIHQLGTENLHLTQSSIVTKWFQNSSLSTALACCSFTMKLATSLSGVMYPEFYDVNHDLYLPFLIGNLACVLSLLCTVVVVMIDKKADQHKVNKNSAFSSSSVQSSEEDYTKKNKFNFSDIRQFGALYWIYILQTFFLWGLFYAFQGYAQPILISKFGFVKSDASKSLSIVSFTALAAPIFGYFADRYAKRALFLILTIMFGAGAILLLLVLPTYNEDSSTVGVYLSLVLFGVYLTLLCAYLWPAIPLFINKQYIGTAFGICYAVKNLAVSLFSFMGGKIMGSDDSGYQNFLLTLLLFFLGSMVIAVITLVYDKRNNNILDIVLITKHNQEIKKCTEQFIN